MVWDQEIVSSSLVYPTMYCKIKHTECRYAGITITQGCPELGEEEGYHIHPVCGCKEECAYGETRKTRMV